jgi:predicted O-linked N-acetylglucosamine transferase (SPINDLY family)
VPLDVPPAHLAGRGLAFLFMSGSSQSKESDERIEAKLDRLIEERGMDVARINQGVNTSL